ncbi:MAG: KdsC family phosphatase [Acidobacteriota bacterium]
MARLTRQEYEARLRRIRLLAMDVDGVLTRGDIIYLGGSSEGKMFHVRDGAAMYIARLVGFRTVVITGRRSQAVQRRMEELPVDDLRQGVLDKLSVCREIQMQHGISDDEVAYIGDDLIDLQLMEQAGLGIAVADAQPQLLQLADWVTDRKGGCGAVREVVDDIVTAKGLWEEITADYRRQRGELAADALQGERAG